MTLRARWWQLVGAYIVATAVLASIDATYEWYSPIDSSEGRSDWYSVAGLRSGALLLGSHEPPSYGRFQLSLHVPELCPLPFYVGAGPEGGAAIVAVWLVCALGGGAHFLVRARRQRRMPS